MTNKRLNSLNIKENCFFDGRLAFHEFAQLCPRVSMPVNSLLNARKFNAVTSIIKSLVVPP